MRTLIALTLGLVTWTVAGAASRYPCYRPAVTPVIDGNVKGDPAWQSVPVVTGFSVLGDGYTMAKQTYAQACWDDQAFYVAVTCEEPDAAHLKPVASDGGWTWSEDSLEIFLQPVAGGQVYQIGVTAGGAKGSGEGSPDISKMQAAAHIGADFYSIELRVPYSVLGTTAPKAGAQWRGNFCRDIFTTISGGDKFTSWAPLKSRFLEPEHFGYLTFLNQKLPAGKVAAISADLSRDYRQTLIAAVAKAAAQAPAYRQTLAEAAARPAYARDARNLQRQWRQIQDVCARADKAPASDLRRVLMGLNDLVRNSYEIKYRYLLDELVAGD